MDCCQDSRSDPGTTECSPWLIALHCGAGFHSKSKEKSYMELMRECCKMAEILLRNGRSAVDSVCETIKLLENSPLTNAGVGSNLNLNGAVQCDAAITNGENDFAAVGALENIRNPISAARALLELQRNSLLGLAGLVSPLILVGKNADEWALKNNIIKVHNKDLITEKSLKNFHKAKLKLDRLLNQGQYKMKDVSTESDTSKKMKFENINTHLQDTVGAICIDCHGNIASGISSGGSILKQPGRIGHSAIYGAGCWASVSTCKVAVNTTGCGEHIIKTFLAKEYAETLASSKLDSITQNIVTFLKEKFINHPSIVLQPNKVCGVLGFLNYVDEGKQCLNLFASQTSHSFGYAFASSGSRCQVFMSRMTESEVPGEDVLTHEYCVKL